MPTLAVNAPTRRGWCAAAATLVLALGAAGVTAGAASAQAPGGCPVAETPAVTFDGLPSKIVIGPIYKFGFADNSDAANTVAGDQVEIMMVDDHGRKFFEGVTRQRNPDTFGVALDLGDRSATLTASYVEERPDGSLCTRTLTHTILGLRRIYFPNRCQDGVLRPRSIIVACGDGNLQLRDLRWSAWNRSVTLGRGVALANDCTPYCAVGRFHRYRVSVRLWRPRRCVDTGRYQYTRLRITFRDRAWTGPRRETIPFQCPTL